MTPPRLPNGRPVVFGDVQVAKHDGYPTLVIRFDACHLPPRPGVRRYEYVVLPDELYEGCHFAFGTPLGEYTLVPRLDPPAMRMIEQYVERYVDQ